MRKLPALASLTALCALTACGTASGAANPVASTTAPAITVSAARACLDLAKWYETTNLKTSALPATFHGGNLALLHRAVQEAPSGTLYQDLSTVQHDVLIPLGTGQTEAEAVVYDVTFTENYCQSVNPGT